MSYSTGAFRVAFLLAAENLTESDVLDAADALKRRGAQVDLIGPASREIQVLRRGKDGVTTKTVLRMAHTLNEIDSDAYELIALPAGVMEDGGIRADADVLRFLQDAHARGKPFLCFPESHTPEGERTPRFELKQLLSDSWQNWNAIDAPRLGAALAYYTLLSLAPLVLLMVAIAGLVFPRDMVQSGLIAPVRELMGSQVAATVSAVFANSKTATGFLAGILSIVVLMVGASGVLLELRDSLDTVWGVKPHYGTGLLSLIRERAFAFMVILGTGLMLLIFLALSTIFTAPAHFLMHILPADLHETQIAVAAGSFSAMTFIFALIYKVIPDTSIRWTDVWIGALITSLLFTVGKLLIALYLTHAGIGSPYATAGSLVVFLTWVYYSAQIFLLGAEFTHVYALRHGSYSQEPEDSN